MAWSTAGTKMEAIAQLLKDEPTLTPREVAKRLNTQRGYVYQVMRKRDIACSPLNRRMCRVEERLKAMEQTLLKVLAAKGLSHMQSEVGL